MFLITVSDQDKQDIEEEGMDPEDLYKSGKMPEMMSHWYTIRKKYPLEYLVAYRMGDFYEFFYDDAINVSRMLGLTLTKRGSGRSRHHLAGIPHHAKQHFKALVSQGRTVVIVEQLEDPKDAKKAKRIVKRGVVRILSPGTIVDDNLLDSTESNFIASIEKDKQQYGIALIDVSSGEFYTMQFTGNNALLSLWSYMSRFRPVECVLSEKMVKNHTFMSQLRENLSIVIKEYATYQFEHEYAKSTLLKHFNVENLYSFAIEDDIVAISASGGLLAFIRDSHKKESLKNITRIQRIHEEDYMFIDRSTQRNLELLQNQADGGTYATLYDILNNTCTPMGTRLLKKWIVQPLLSIDEIDDRLSIVQWFIEHYEDRIYMRKILKEMGDLMRLATRVNYSSTANARDLNSIKYSLQIIGEIKNCFEKIGQENIPDSLNYFIKKLHDFDSLIKLIEKSIKEDPPTTITEGGIIKEGYNEEIDEYRDILENGKDWIIALEEKEKRKFGIKTGLKIGFNRVLGYYIQITDNTMKQIHSKIPEDYMKRQTLKGSVRFETEDLKSMETKILSAEDNLYSLEYDLFQKVREQVQNSTLDIQQSAQIMANLDVLANFATIAQNNDYCKPELKEHSKIIIKEGRHAVVEKINKKEPFVPNDCFMNLNQNQVLIITGPNWSGKSTYLRQVALIVLMSQIGCFVPASKAEIGVVDRVFTRIGASDDLARGQSTFMLEMNETAEILNYMSQKSLIIIDEIGRGTGTIDGLSIAQSVVEYLHDFGVKTLFSTHFHHLIKLKLPRIHNYHFKIIEKEDSNELIFLRQLSEGGTDKSYGIHVGEMAGLPRWVVERSFEIMNAVSDEKGIGEMPNLPERSDLSREVHEIERNLKEKEEDLAVEKKFIDTEKEKIHILRKELEDKKKELDKKYEEIDQEKLSGKNIHSKISSSSKKKRKTQQMALFPVTEKSDPEVVQSLKKVKLNEITPVDALNLLAELKKKID